MKRREANLHKLSIWLKFLSPLPYGVVVIWLAEIDCWPAAVVAGGAGGTAFFRQAWGRLGQLGGGQDADRQAIEQ